MSTNTIANNLSNLSYQTILIIKEYLDSYELSTTHPNYDTITNARKPPKNREKLTKFTTINYNSDLVKIVIGMLGMVIKQISIIDDLHTNTTRESLIKLSTITNPDSTIIFMHSFSQKYPFTNYHKILSIIDNNNLLYSTILNELKKTIPSGTAEHISTIVRDIYIDFIRSLNLSIGQFIYMKHIKIDKPMILGFFIQAGISNYLLSEIDSIPIITKPKRKPKKTDDTTNNDTAKTDDNENESDNNETDNENDNENNTDDNESVDHTDDASADHTDDTTNNDNESVDNTDDSYYIDESVINHDSD